MTRKILITAAAFAIFLSAPPASFAGDVVGSTTWARSETELRTVAQGWSIRELIGQRIYNEQGEAIGRVHDVIIAPDGWVSYAIISAGAYVHLTRHDVAVPVSFFVQRDTRFVLPGATKEALRSAPAFEYAR